MRPSELDPERWRRIDAVFEAALETPPPERAAFLDETCGEDEDLRSQVEALLRAHERADDRFETPVSSLAAELLAAREEPPEGRRVGPFRLVREIGRGGMGVVYLAEDTRIGRSVALKALPPWLGVGAEAKQRFMSEARAVSALDHPNIATLYEADETELGQLYMAFAYYAGETLAQRIARGPLAPGEAVAVALGIARGLAMAHERGIVHRDVKPSNVLLTEAGEVKLLDFGVAKVAGEDVTRDGVMLGTLAYMSPEQATAGSVDYRTDLWSLGVVLYEMLTGSRPFDGADRSSLIDHIRGDVEDPPIAFPVDLPPDIERVITKLLQREPDDRYPGTADLLGDLEALEASGHPAVAIAEPPPRAGTGLATESTSSTVPTGATHPRPETPSWRRRGVVAVAVVVAVGAWLLRGLSGGGDAPIGRLAVLPLQDLTGEPDQQHLVAGVHDALIADLGKIGSLGVISRTSVLRYADAGMTVPEIARDLEVDAVIEGSVSRQGDTLAVTTTLVRAAPERQLWTATYRLPVGGVFEMTGEAARSIAGELGILLSEAERTRLGAGRAVDPAAYEAYALGLFHVEQRTQESFDQARRYLLAAIDADSTFAPAYAGLAQAFGSAAFFGLLRPSDVMPRVTALAETALRHDSTLAQAHTVLGSIELYWNWDWEAAERRFRRAIELNPSHAGSHRSLGEVLSTMGRHREALESVKRGAILGRRVAFSDFRPVVVLNYMREFEEAIALAEDGLDFFPYFWQGHWLLCQALIGAEDARRAVEACEEAAALSDRQAMSLGLLGYAYAVAGRPAAAEEIVGELETRAVGAYVGGTQIAAIHGALGASDRAFFWLERAFEERDVSLVHINDDVMFGPLRTDPRFASLLARIGLDAR